MRPAQTACARLLAACAATALGTSLAAAAGPEVIFSEIASSPTSSVPGAVDAAGNSAATTFDIISDLQSNLDGTAWLLDASTAQATAIDSVLILGGGTSGTSIMQEGRPIPGGQPDEIVDFVAFDIAPAGFNNAGDFAFSARSSLGELLMKSTAGSLGVYLREGDPLFGLDDSAPIGSDGPGNETQGNTISATHVLDDGRVAFIAYTIENISTFRDPAIMIGDSTVFMQPGITSVTDLFGNTEFVDAVGLGDFGITPDGLHSYILGDHEGSTTSDGILIVDGNVVIQEGRFIPGTTVLTADSSLSAIEGAGMLPNGDWFANGDIEPDLGGGEYAVRNGVIVARTGAAIFPGSSETWGASLSTPIGNVAGDTIVVGNTSNPDTSADNVAVLNGAEVILREGDPIDLDGNGMFDDNVFLAGIDAAGMFLTPDFRLYFLATLRNGAGTSLGDAFLTEQILTPTPGDVAVQINDSPDPLGVIGGQITYNVTVRNFSPDPATNVVVATTLDGSTSFVSSSTGAHAAGVHTANLGTVDPLSAQTYQVVVQANSAGSPSATAVVAATEVDPNVANNTASAETAVEALADVAVAVIDSPDPMNIVDGQITYDITVTNNGPSAASSVVFTADLAPESTFFSTTAGSHAGGVVTANLGNLGVGAVANLTIVVDSGVNASYVASFNAVSGTTDPATADNTAVATTDVLVDSNLGVTAAIDPPALGGLGQQATYTLEINNAGPTVATGVDWSLSLPAEVTYVSSSAGGHAAGVVSGTVSSIDSAATEVITVLVESNAVGSDLVATFTANPGVPGDSDLSDNSATAEVTIFTGGPNIDVIVADDDLNAHAGGTLTTSQAPGLVGREFESFSKIYGSGDGSNWITEANLDNTSTLTDNVVLTFTDAGLQIALQEGVTLIPDGSGQDIDSDFDFKVSINNAGAYAVQARATSAIETILKGTGSNIPGGVGTLALIAKGGNPFPFNPAFNYGNTSTPGLESPNILDNGDVIFLADTTDAATDFDEYVLRTSDDGATVTVIAQEGVTVPLNGFDAWDDFDQNDIHFTPDGAHSLMHGDVGTATANDKSLVYDGNIVVQESITVLPGFGFSVQPSSPFDDTFLASNGDWYAWGTNNNNGTPTSSTDDTEHWMARNGQVIAQSGAPIFTGSSEVWRSTSTSSSFNALAADASGNYVICGFTDNPDTADNAVAVLNGERIVARELDPVDLDGNGLFDDNTFIGDIGNGSTITTDFGVITPDGKLVIPVKLRTFDSTTRIGDAIVAIDLGLAPACVCEMDGDANQVNVFDLLAFLDLWFVNAPGADIDGAAGVDVFDLLFFLDCWFPASAGTPC